MTAADQPRFAALMLELSGAFGREVDETTTEAFFRALEDQPFDLVEKAVRRHLRDGMFFPRPTELRIRRPPARRLLLEHRGERSLSMREKFQQLAADLAAKQDPTRPAAGDAAPPEDPAALEARRTLLRDQANMLRAKGDQ